MTLRRLAWSLGFVGLLVVATGCSSSADTSATTEGAGAGHGHAAGTGAGDGAGGHGTSHVSTTSHGVGGGDAASSVSSAASTSDATSATSTVATTATTATSSGTGGGDPNADARARCYAKINALRASHVGGALPPYTAWHDAEACVDTEVTSDETSGVPHQAWSGGSDACKGFGQNECLGQGPAGVESCLDSMWAEREQAECAGCDACAGNSPGSSCPSCDFYGSGPAHHVCGHYANLSSTFFTEVVCGFSALGGWDAMNFQ